MRRYRALLIAVVGVQVLAAAGLPPIQVRTANGVVQGVVSADGKVRAFKGIPYAAPPVGALRWKAPQPAPSWTGVRKALDYGNRCMQGRVFDDMVFHDAGPSEDCLYLNVWAPATGKLKRLPVMVWIYGGGFVAGATSETRQDGGNLSKKGVVVVSMNYRLGIFGFYSHPELTKESGRNASGNYGLLDQAAALEWVKKNIARFGGDPGNVTIFGESAGSFSVSALMASPLAQGLFAKAIGESGAFFSDTLPAKPRAETEAEGVKFAETALGTGSLEALRQKPADELLKAASKGNAFRFSPNIDGYFLPEDVYAIYAAGKQSKVPLLAGWNRDELNYHAFFQRDAPTVENYVARLKKRFAENADHALKLYPGENEAQAKRSATDLASDGFISYSTWKWLEMQLKTGQAPVYRYRFDQALPVKDPTKGEPTAYHSGEIEYVFEVLASKDLPFGPEDFKVSDLMSSYWTNFAKTGDPNGAGLPRWPAYTAGGYQVMHLSATPAAASDDQRARYAFLDSLSRYK